MLSQGHSGAGGAYTSLPASLHTRNSVAQMQVAKPDFKRPNSPVRPSHCAGETAAWWKLCCGLSTEEKKKKRHNSSTSLPTPALGRKEKTPPGTTCLW